MLNTKIRSDWRKIDQRYREWLKEYVVKQICNNLNEGGDASVLKRLNEVLVGMIRIQWDPLLKDFVNFANTDQPLSTLLNNLTILRLLLEEGFKTIEERVSPYEFQRFRDSLDQDMRCVLKLLCQCLESEGADRPAKVGKCLDALRLAVDNISTLELFKCNIIQLLVGLIGQQEFRKPLIACFQEIFKLEYEEISDHNYPLIAKQLVLILKTYLEQYQAKNHIGNYPNRTAPSQYSFQRKSDYTEMLELLYIFLTRCMPFLGKTPVNQEMSTYASYIEMCFSKELYQSLGLIYQRMLNFVMDIAQHFNTLVQVQTAELHFEQKKKVLSCLRLMLAIHSKLRLEREINIKEVIEVCIRNFTPIDPQFSTIYLSYHLLKNGLTNLKKQPPFSSDLCQEYMEFIRSVLLQTATLKEFMRIITQIVQINDNQAQWNMGEEILHMQTAVAINTINRVCWSFVMAFICVPQAIRDINVVKFYNSLINLPKFQRYMDLKDCCAINSIYILQVFYPDNHNIPTIIRTMGTKKPLMTEFVLRILQLGPTLVICFF